MCSLKDGLEIVEKLKLDPGKIPISKAFYREIVEKAKELSFNELMKKKNN